MRIVLETLAEHGRRIEGLEPRETITVAIRLTGGGEGVPFTFLDPSDDDAGTRWLRSYVSEAATAEQHVVVQISKSALDALAGTSPSADEVRSRALVHRY